MKKIIASLTVLLVFMISLPLSAEAASQCSCRRPRAARRASYSRSYAAPRSSSYYAPRYRTAGYAAQQPSFYRRHRNLVNLGVATGGGAFLGALLGGRRGALLGTAIGAGSGALYTYGINKKRRRY